jgi:hypothetical protein
MNITDPRKSDCPDTESRYPPALSRTQDVHMFADIHRPSGEKAVAAAGKMRKTFNMIMITISCVNVRDEIDFH